MIKGFLFRLSIKLLIIVLFITNFSNGLNGQADSLPGPPDMELTESGSKVNFRIYPTENMWNFIKLDTRDGRLWMVQYSLDDKNQFQRYLNPIPLAYGEDAIANRFVLKPTTNMWNFILLDQVDGRVWQVQWSLEPESIGIWPIE